MNTWPTLKEWWQFGGALALEVGILFLAAKLIAPRLRSPPWRRALWQTAVIAMFIVVVGELNGVRGLMRPRSEPVAIVPPQRTVVVTFKDVEMPAEFPLDAAGSSQPMTATQSVVIPRWQQRAAWPALVWLAGAMLVASRVLLAQFIALVFRFRCRRIDDAGLNGRTERIRHTLGIRRRVALVVSKRAIAPFTFGTLRPVIVLPQRFTETFTPEQQEAALLHEMAHVVGFDSAWRGVSDLMGALLWWHPLVWLARCELAHASELAADESSLLLHDGPGRLAECLVACAKELRRPALTTWLGMDGGGFRSALGQRVTRLLALPAQARLSRPLPWYVRLIAPVVCTALLWIGMTAVLKDASPRGSAWRNSILGTVLAAADEKPLTDLPPATKAEVAKLIQDGKLYYEAGRYEAARTNLQAALQLDPKSQGAAYFLEIVEANLSIIAARRPGVISSADPNSTNATPVDPARQAIYDKLRQTRLKEWGPIDNLPLSEVVRFLIDEMRRRDPEGKGVNIIINSSAASAVDEMDAATGLPKTALERVDLNGVSIRLGTLLKDVSYEEVLNIIISIADRPIQYTVETYGVVFTAKSKPGVPLFTRFFRLDPAGLQQALNSMHPKSTPKRTPAGAPRGGQNTGGVSPTTEVMPAEAVIPAVRKWFTSLGVDLSGAGKTVYFNERLGTLMVRATLGELDTIEKALQFVSMNPPQLTIQVKVMEVERKPGDKNVGQYLGSFPGANIATTNPPRLANSLTVEGMRNSAAQPATMTGILTDAQFRTVIKALEQRGGTDLLSAPQVTTFSGRQAQIKVVDIKYIVTDLDVTEKKPKKKDREAERKKEFEALLDPTKKQAPTVEPQVTDDGSVIQPIAEPFELGPVVDITPWVQADGYTIQMTVVPSLREFLGYDDPGDFVASVPDGKTNKVTSPTPLPKFRLRKVETSAAVFDGQTLVIGAGSAKHLVQKTNPDGTTTNTFVEKELFYFITPCLIDAAGNRLHSEEEQPFARKNAPPR